MIKIITISGIDGSGKSTQVELLRQHLEAKGQKIYYFHAIQFSILQKIKSKIKPSQGNSQGSSVTSSSVFGIWLRQAALKIDLWRFNKLLRQLSKNSYDFLLSDRYFYDTVINIAYLKHAQTGSIKKISKPNYAFFLTVNPADVMGRERKPDQGIDYLKQKNILYAEFASSNNLIKIKAAQTPDKVFASIKDFLK